MNSRDVFLLVIVEQALAMGIFLFEVWLVTRRERQAGQVPKASAAEGEAGSPQPYLVSVNRLPRPVETQPVTLASADDERLSVHVGH